MNFAQRLAQRLNFALVSEFLALGQFDEFEHFLHLVERLFERFDNLRHFFNRLADGGRRGFDFSFGQCRRVGRRTRLGNLFRSSRAATTAAAMATPPVRRPDFAAAREDLVQSVVSPAFLVRA